MSRSKKKFPISKQHIKGMKRIAHKKFRAVQRTSLHQALYFEENEVVFPDKLSHVMNDWDYCDWVYCRSYSIHEAIKNDDADIKKYEHGIIKSTSRFPFNPTEHIEDYKRGLRK
jgi:hypothetical protein